jgi:phospholipase C
MAAMSGQLGHIIDKAYAAEPTKHAPLSDIEHVVFVMMENRSFDHYFGTYRGVRGFGDPWALPGVFEQRGWKPGVGPSKDGHLPPFHLNTKDLASYAECVDDITHNWAPQHEAWNDGKMNRWVKAHLARDKGSIGPLTMGYYEEEDIPFYRGIADAFTICDDYYCSVIGPTDPNRVMWFSATIDPEGRQGGPCLETLVATRAEQFGKFTWKTMPEHLSEAGISWKVYQDASDLTLLNPLLYFKNFTDKSTFLGKNASGAISYPVDFEADVLAGKLPAVSWIFPDFLSCDHPSAPPILGEAFVAGVLKTIVDKPALWEKTAIVVMYDENGGFFDHVPPPTPPPGTPGEFLTMDTLPKHAYGVRGPVGLGFRVPCLILSPYSRGGFVCADTFDHTSQLKFLEKRFGVDVPNISKWRRETVGDLVSAFSFGRKPSDDVPELPNPLNAEGAKVLTGECVITGNGPLGVEDLGKATPIPDHVPAPRQAKGTRKAPIAPTTSVKKSGGSGTKQHQHKTASKAGASGGGSAATSNGDTGSAAATGDSLPSTGLGPDLPIAAVTVTAAAATLMRLRDRRANPPGS